MYNKLLNIIALLINCKMKKKYIYPRIYCNEKLKLNNYIYLSIKNSHYIIKVLRMRLNSIIEIFNNTNYIFYARIVNTKKANIIVQIFQNTIKNYESPLRIHLGQSISKKEKMEFTIQKSIELGVSSITPLLSDKCDLKINKTIIHKKISHWEKIAIASCQQCHRNIVPIINTPVTLKEWCKKTQKSTNIIFHPGENFKMNDIIDNKSNNFNLLIGPESGFSNDDIQISKYYQFIPISLGKRILRTETASVVALSILQFKFGDLS